MDLGLDGRVALVTASSKGLGLASARALAEEGCNLVISARGREALERATTDLEDLGAEVEAVVGDVTNPESPTALARAAVERFGRLDVLVANCGGPPPARALEVDDDTLATALNANLMTSVRLVKACAPHMQERGWGRICLLTSISVKQPIPSLALSNAARAGLWGWAKTAAQDLFPDGVTLNLTCPGLHATDRMKELGGPEGAAMGEPEDFGKVVAFLCSQPARFISGSAVQVDGAATLGLL